MRIQVHTNSNWIGYYQEGADPNTTSFSPYKLHIALAPEHHADCQEKIAEILKTALQNNIISHFKVLNIGVEEAVQKAVAEQVHRKRVAHNPITVYLPNSPDMGRLAGLCEEIETVLEKLPQIADDCLSIADLPVTEHTSLRQESLEGEYAAVFSADESTLTTLKEQAENSAEYRTLRALIEQGKVNKNMLEGFYDRYYQYYTLELASDSIQRQFSAACAFLSVKLKVEEAEKWQDVIASSYKRLALKYHPDRFQMSNKETQSKATALFQLLSKAKAVLETISQDPSILDHKTLLAQQAYRPRSQYELAEAGHYDPYYFVSIAKSEKKVPLKQYWDYKEAKIAIASEDGGSQGALVEKPELTVFPADQPKLITLPGYEAFYNLLKSGALPNHFDSSHFGWVFYTPDGGVFSAAQKWLLKRALLDPDFLVRFRSSLLLECARLATEQNLVSIGKTHTEVFLHYAEQYPRVTWGMSVNSLEYKLDISVIEAHVARFPDILFKLGGGTLSELMEESESIRLRVLSSKDLMASLSTNYKYISLLKPFFLHSNSEVDVWEPKDIREMALKELFLGDAEFLPYLSTKVLKNLAQQCREQPRYMPVWVVEALEVEMTARQTGAALASPEKKHTESSRKQLDAEAWIKVAYLRDDSEILPYLSVKALLFLAEQPEIQWPDYYAIVLALGVLGESKASESYAVAVQTALGVSSWDGVEEKLEQIEAAKKQCREEVITDLLHEYDQAIRGIPGSMPVSQLRKRLEAWGSAVNKRVSAVSNKYRSELNNDFNMLLGRLRSGEYTNELENQFLELRRRVEHFAGEDSGYWKCMGSQNGMPNQIIGNEAYSLMREIFRLASNVSLFAGSAQSTASHFSVKLDSDDIFIPLQQLFFIYKVLSSPREFYDTMALVLSHKVEFEGSSDELDQKFITDRLLPYLNNELAVYLDGNRASVSQVTTGYRSGAAALIDHQNIQEFEVLYSLYKRLGQEEHFLKLLPEAYEKLSAIADRGGLQRYMTIREHVFPTHATLEYRAVYRLVSDLLNDVVRKPENKPQSMFDVQKNNLIGVVTKVKDISSSQTLTAAQKTKALLGLLANLLDSLFISETVKQALLDEIANTPILAQYFRLSEVAHLNPKQQIQYLVRMIQGGSFPEEKCQLALTSAVGQQVLAGSAGPTLAAVRAYYNSQCSFFSSMPEAIAGAQTVDELKTALLAREGKNYGGASTKTLEHFGLRT